MNAIKLRNLIGLTVAGACLTAMIGCLGAASSTGNDGARLSTQTKGSVADTTKSDSACGRHGEDDKDSLEAKGVNEKRDSAEAKEEIEVGGKGCNDGDHHRAEGGPDGKDDQEVKDGEHEGIGGGKAGDDHETKDDSLEVAGAIK